MSTDSTIKASAKEKIKGWIKMAIGTAGGLLSGAVVMYVTPLVDKVVRPSKPLANFSHEKDGLKIRFQNLSSGGQGWWEFGDGTPLEPVSPEREFVNHVYTRPGEYTVKMTLRNVLGEENERQVVVRLDPPTTLEPTKVLNLEAVPVSAGSYAPATFKIMSKVKNAQLCVWDLGDDRPLEVTNAQGNEKMVTFQKPGGYVIKLAAVNGLDHDQKTEIVNEESKLEPLSLYAETKVINEKQISEHNNFLIYRFATAFGSSPRMRLDLLVNDFAYKAIREGYLVVYEKNHQRSFIHVNDIAESIVFGINNFERLKNDIFNIGDDKMNYSKEEICNLLKEKIKKLHVHFAEFDKDIDQRNYIVSYDKIKKLGYKTKIDINNGLDDLIRSFQLLNKNKNYTNI
jgi:PKD repeat protein/ribosomal protein S15P/S13E